MFSAFRMGHTIWSIRYGPYRMAPVVPGVPIFLTCDLVTLNNTDRYSIDIRDAENMESLL